MRIGFPKLGGLIHLSASAALQRAHIPEAAQNNQQEQERHHHAPAIHTRALDIVIPRKDAPVALAVDQAAQILPEHLHIVQVVHQGSLSVIGRIEIHG